MSESGSLTDIAFMVRAFKDMKLQIETTWPKLPSIPNVPRAQTPSIVGNRTETPKKSPTPVAIKEVQKVEVKSNEIHLIV